MTNHKIYYSGAQEMSDVEDKTVDLVVTSPPYPMIEMWDEIMMNQNPQIKRAFDKKEYNQGYELIHQELDKVWAECHRVMKKGGIACINIGDATRTLDKNFALFPNHARIIQAFIRLGFQNLPHIIWRKQTNAPNKFMGSGMLPPGAYVTLEHEYILIFRKGEKRSFIKEEDKAHRRGSSYFWEERNVWFSDLWDIKGARQKLIDKVTRERSAAYPFIIPYRLINMFSVQDDTILDPFMGTGTSTLAAITSNRNSIGIEIDPTFKSVIEETVLNSEETLNNIIKDRLSRHEVFVKDRIATRGKDAFKYKNDHYGFSVLTRQEREIIIPLVDRIVERGGGYEVEYNSSRH